MAQVFHGGLALADLLEGMAGEVAGAIEGQADAADAADSLGLSRQQSAIARRSATITTGIGTPSSVNRAPSGSISRKQGSTCGSSSSRRGEGVRRKASASSGARKRGGASRIRAQRQAVAPH
ncbi:MAG: hypothetical protein ACKOPT_08310 [Cyanobium sp.]